MSRVQQARDEGFGIVEALVAILLFGILAVAMVPPIVAAVKVSGAATTIASAGQVAQGRIEEARAASGSCAEIQQFLQSAVPATLTDSRGATYTLVETATAVKADGSTVNAKSDSTWCVDGDVQSFTYNVKVTSVAVDNPDVADVSTIVAVPGVGVA